MARKDSAAPADGAEGAAPKRRFRRLRQIGDAYRMTRSADRWVGWVVLGTFLAGWGLMVGIGLLLGPSLYFALLGVPVGVMVALIVFGRRAERAAYAQVEGQPGAAAAVLQNVRGWTVTPAVAANRQQDLVSRAVGRPGIVLIGEGDPQRLTGLLATERKKMTRYLPDTPIHEISVGLYAEQVPLKKVQRTLRKLPKELAPAQVTEVRQRLNALGGLMQAMPIPKGPMPKGGRVPRGKVR
jgi:Domain of unknown function (DUF4191)